MSGAIVVRRFTPSEFDKLAKKRNDDMNRKKSAALAKVEAAKKRAAVQAVPKMPPLPLTPEEIAMRAEVARLKVEADRVRSVRDTIRSIRTHESTKPQAERQPLFDAYLELCSKVKELPDPATLGQYERFQSARDRR